MTWSLRRGGKEEQVKYVNNQGKRESKQRKKEHKREKKQNEVIERKRKEMNEQMNKKNKPETNENCQWNMENEQGTNENGQWNMENEKGKEENQKVKKENEEENMNNEQVKMINKRGKKEDKQEEGEKMRSEQVKKEDKRGNKEHEKQMKESNEHKRRKLDFTLGKYFLSFLNMKQKLSDERDRTREEGEQAREESERLHSEEKIALKDGEGKRKEGLHSKEASGGNEGEGKSKEGEQARKESRGEEGDGKLEEDEERLREGAEQGKEEGEQIKEEKERPKEEREGERGIMEGCKQVKEEEERENEKGEVAMGDKKRERKGDTELEERIRANEEGQRTREEGEGESAKKEGGGERALEWYIIYTPAFLDNSLTGEGSFENESNTRTFKRTSEKHDLLDINESMFQMIQLDDTIKEHIEKTCRKESKKFELIREFMQNFRFAVQQPTIMELEEVMKEKAKELKVDIDPSDLRRAVRNKVREWHMTIVEEGETFKYFTEIEGASILLEVLSSTYKNSVTLNEVNFTDTTDLVSAIGSNNPVLCISTSSTKLCYNRLIQTMGEKSKHMQLDFERLKKIKHLFRLLPHLIDDKIIIVLEKECQLENDRKILKCLINCFVRANSGNDKRRSFLVSRSCLKKSIDMSEYEEDIHFVRDQAYDFESLSEKTRNSILEKSIDFQGNNIALKQLCDDKTPFTTSIIETLVSESCITVGKPVTSLKVKGKFIERKLYSKRISLSKILDLNNQESLNDHEYVLVASPKISSSVISKIPESQANIHICNEEEEEEAVKKFEQLCTLYPGKSIHMLKVLEHDEENITLQLLLTKGSFDELREIADKRKILNYTELVNEPVAVLASESGMGKTILISHIAEEEKEKHKDKWVVYVPMKYIARNLLTNDTNEFAQSFSEIFAVKELDKLLLQHCIRKTGKFIFLLDGYDEIESNHRENFLDIVKKLKSNSLGLTVITTKLHLHEELENAASTFAYHLERLAKREQQELLNEIWIRDLNFSSNEARDNSSNVAKDNVQDYARKLIQSFLKNNDKSVRSLLEIPLLLTIIGEVYKENCRKYVTTKKFTATSVSSILTLYKSFEETKYDNFAKKENINAISGSIGKNIKQILLQNHRNESMQVAMEEPLLSSKFSCNCCMTIKPVELTLLDEEHILAIGILQKMNTDTKRTDTEKNKMGKDKKKFIHDTFAVYFFALHIVHIFSKSKHCPEFTKYMREIFFRRDYSLLRMFVNIDSSLPQIHSAVLSNNLDQLKEELQDATAIKKKDALGRTAYHIAATHGKVQALQLMLTSNSNVETVDKLNFTPVDVAVELKNGEICLLLFTKQVKFKLNSKKARTFLECLFKNLGLELNVMDQSFPSFHSSECLDISDWFSRVLTGDHVQKLLQQLDKLSDIKRNIIVEALQVCIPLLIEKVIRENHIDQVVTIISWVKDSKIEYNFSSTLETWTKKGDFLHEAVLLATLLNSEESMNTVFQEVAKRTKSVPTYILQEFENGMTLVQFALEYYLENSVRFLIKKLSRDDISRVFTNFFMEQNRIHLAVEMGHRDLLCSYIQLLRSNGQEVYLSHKDSSVKTLLDEAAIKNDAQILSLLNLEINIITRNS